MTLRETVQISVHKDYWLKIPNDVAKNVGKGFGQVRV